MYFTIITGFLHKKKFKQILQRDRSKKEKQVKKDKAFNQIKIMTIVIKYVDKDK